MTATFKQEEINVREQLNVLECLPSEVEYNNLKPKWFVGDAIEVDFTVQDGLVPFQTFAVAPASGADIAIYCKGIAK